MLKGALILATAVAVCTVPAFASTVIKAPEPATFGLLASGIAGVALFRQMRKR